VRVGVLGTGMVGSTIGTKLVSLGHEVMMGSREAGGEKARAWVEAAGAGASEGTFADAAAFGELVFNCTAGIHSLAALEAADPANLAGKILVDVANPLDFSQGFPPSLAVANTDSVGEQLQRVLDGHGVGLGRGLELSERERLRGDDEQRLECARQLCSRRHLGGDQAERTFQERLLSASAREILIGANGAAWAIAISFCLRSSRSAMNATATSIRPSVAR